MHFGKSIIRKPAAISGTLAIPVIHTQAIWLIVSWVLTSPGIMRGQCWPSHELRAMRGNHLHCATVSNSGQKCPISGSLGQAHEIYLPLGMGDLETLLVTFVLHTDTILPLLNPPYNWKVSLFRNQHFTEHLPVMQTLGKHKGKLEWTAARWKERKQPVCNFKECLK